MRFSRVFTSIAKLDLLLIMSDDSDFDPDFIPESDDSELTSDDDESTSNSNANSDGDTMTPPNRGAGAGSSQRPVQRAQTSSNASCWYPPTGTRQQVFPFTGTPGVKNIPQLCETELDYFLLFVDEEIINLMVTMTNCYAVKTKITTTLRRSSRLNDWKDCDQQEMKKFIGLLMWMGLKKLPKIADYWSRNPLYENKVAGSTMSRNRFELLLRCWHFEDTFFAETSRTDKLIKIRRLVQLITTKYQNFKTPDEYLTVDETMVAFRGRIKFMQYIPGKRHKYGIKLFKICGDDGYTFDLIVYEGKKGPERQQNLSKNVVMELSTKFLDAGRSIITDNYYTSVDLAESLLQHSTHLIGTVRKNRKGLPKNVVGEKLKKGELVAMENEKGILVFKWKDKREVLALSTKHKVGFVTVTSKRNKNKCSLKPIAIADYNKHKCSIDLSDQMGSYCNPSRRSIRWFQKLAVELILNTSVINAFLVYTAHKRVKSKRYTITKFREQLSIQLLGLYQESTNVAENREAVEHKFGKNPIADHRNRIIRRKCIHCYQLLRLQGKTSVEAKKLTKKTNTVCLLCPTKPSVCAECFATIHTKK